MHGESECVGNKQQLCAAKYWRRESEEKKEGEKEEGQGEERGASWEDSWNFIQCQNFGPRLEIGTEATADRCAKLVGRKWSGAVKECAEGSEGEELLAVSAQTAQDLDIQKSCTMIINGRQVCIHDSTWKECAGGHEPVDFARQVRQEFDEINRAGLVIQT